MPIQRIYHDVDPYIIRIYGDVGIRWFSLAYLLGFFLVRWYLVRVARAGEVLSSTSQPSIITWCGD